MRRQFSSFSYLHLGGGMANLVRVHTVHGEQISLA